MSKVTIYHNPRCSKCRQTLALLEERNLDLSIVEYLDHPPTIESLDAILSALGKEPLEVIRTKEARFSELGLSTSDERSRSEWLRFMVENPILIERPIVEVGGKAAIGRPPETVLALFG